MRHYLFSVDDLFGCIEPRVLGPLLDHVDEVEDLIAGRDILEVTVILRVSLFIVVELCSPRLWALYSLLPRDCH